MTPDLFTPADRAHMRRALALARRAQGKVEPNPMVGAVVVRHGRVISEGYHRQFGGPHAEVWALQAAGKKARDATLYVTLEPCCHWGKTPPCTSLIISSRIARVITAMIDPFAQVSGKGVALLRSAGIRVDVGLLEAEAHAFNAPFITRLTQHRPFIIAKWAQSLDGAIATANGQSQWISSEISRGFVQNLRGRMDGILIGIRTALADDPLLMARPDNGRNIRRLASRIVLDSTCRLPMTSQLVRTIPFAPVLIVHKKNLDRPAEKRRQTLAAKGILTLPIPTDAAGNLRLPPLLKHLADMDYTNLLVEGGGQILASFFRANLVDEAHIFTAPIIIGGQNARHAVAGPDLKKLSHATKLAFLSTSQSGPDLHMILRRP